MRNHIFQLYLWRREKHSIGPLPAKEPLFAVLLCVCRLSVYLTLFFFPPALFPQSWRVFGLSYSMFLWQESELCPFDQFLKRNYLCLLHICGINCQKWQAAMGRADSTSNGEKESWLVTSKQTTHKLTVSPNSLVFKKNGRGKSHPLCDLKKKRQ